MPNERKAHWERIYGERSPLDVSWYQPTPALSLELILGCGLRRDASLIDVGGGASTLIDHLLDLGFTDVSVLDLSANALEHARARLGERAARVHWIEADVTAYRPGRRHDLWHDRAVFHFLVDTKDQQRYRVALEQALVDGGQAIVGTFAPGGPEQCSGLPILQYDAARLLRVLGPAFELLEVRGETHRTPAGKDQPFNFFRLVHHRA